MSKYTRHISSIDLLPIATSAVEPSIPTSAKHPRQLMVLDDKTGIWEATTKIKIVTTISYLAVSYRQSDFPQKEELQRRVHTACEARHLHSYWLDFACTRATQQEKDITLPLT